MKNFNHLKAETQDLYDSIDDMFHNEIVAELKFAPVIVIAIIAIIFIVCM